MSSILQRNPKQLLPLAVKGEGSYIIDETGKKYLNASGGAAVSCLGHSNARVIAAVKNQVSELAFAHTSFFSNQPSEQLADFLISKSPEGIEKAYFVSGGSEAIETALKLSRQYFVEIGQPERCYFISRHQSYHGSTLGALSISGNLKRRSPYESILRQGGILIPPCYAYRYKLEKEDNESYAQRAANELETAILSLGTNKVAAFIAEPVVGSTLGAVGSIGSYFSLIRNICDKYGVLLILDEIMCGMCRTGNWFASEYENIVPDIVAVAKGLGGGYQPIGAVLLQRNIYQAIHAGSGFFQHGHTYLCHPVSSAAALAVQMEIEECNLLSNIRLQSRHLLDGLHKKLENNPYIGEIRGRGLLLGIELVLNKETKEPFPCQLELHKRIKYAALENGLMCYPGSGTVDGIRGDHILLAPPYNITSEEVQEIIDKLTFSISQVLDRLSYE